ILDISNQRTKYEVVYQYIKEFLEKVNDGKYKKEIFELWTGQFHRNASQKQVIKKSDFIWKMIIRLSDIHDTERFKDFFDYEEDEIGEIEERFSDEIENLADGFELSNSVVTAYTAYRQNHSKSEVREFEFIEEYWQSFQDRIIELPDKDCQKIVCQLVIWEMLRNKTLIKKAKEAAGL
ncbi:hypothetical protein, partial [Lactovum odontotermitis]